MRKGIFKISPKLWDSGFSNIMCVFIDKDFKITNMRFDDFSNVYEILGECGSFDELKEGESIPCYTFYWSGHGGVTFEKV